MTVKHGGGLLLAAALTLMGGCATTQTAVIPDNPQPTLPARFSASGDAPAPQRWWQAFGDPQLQALESQALSDSFTLEAARQRLARAAATARISASESGPTVNATLSAKEGDTRNRSLGLAAGYELDLWGRLKAGRDSAQFSYLASREALHTAAISLSAQVASTWYALREREGELALLEEQQATNHKLLELLQMRFANGQARAGDVLQQRGQLKAVEAEQITARREAQVLRHSLAVLLGQAPSAALPEGQSPLPDLPTLPTTGLPGDLVQRRPDLRQAWFQLQAAQQQVAEAAAKRFPSLTLGATLSAAAGNWATLLDNWVKAISAEVVAPLYDSGLRNAQTDQARAATLEALSNYRQAVLQALQEVEDALVQERQQQRYEQNLRERVTLTRELLERQKDYYSTGSVDYLSVLDTLRTLQGMERDLLRARRQRIDYRIALYRALAGPWESQPAPSAQPVP